MKQNIAKVAFLILIVVGFFKLMVHIGAEQEQLRTNRNIRHQLIVQECREHNGIWTPVGGDHLETIYGCVFPSR